jgi:hypothetical protein
VGEGIGPVRGNGTSKTSMIGVGVRMAKPGRVGEGGTLVGLAVGVGDGRVGVGVARVGVGVATFGVGVRLGGTRVRVGVRVRIGGPDPVLWARGAASLVPAGTPQPARMTRVKVAQAATIAVRAVRVMGPPAAWGRLLSARAEGAPQGARGSALDNPDQDTQAGSGVKPGAVEVPNP